MKGPVPSALLVRSPFLVTASWLMMTAAGPVRFVRNEASAFFKVIATVFSSGVVMVSTDARMLALGEAVALSTRRSKLYFTSAEVRALPLWNLTPLRKENV